MKIKLGNGIGGKGLLIFTGDIWLVKNAIEYCKCKNDLYKTIIDHQIINYPSIITINMFVIKIWYFKIFIFKLYLYK